MAKLIAQSRKNKLNRMQELKRSRVKYSINTLRDQSVTSIRKMGMCRRIVMALRIDFTKRVIISYDAILIMNPIRWYLEDSFRCHWHITNSSQGILTLRPAKGSTWLECWMAWVWRWGHYTYLQLLLVEFFFKTM